MSDLITHSEMACADSCLRKHRILYGKCLRPVRTAEALRVGSAVHEGLDLRAQGIAPHEAILRVRGAYVPASANADPDYAYKLACENEMVAQLLTLYFWYWESLDATMEVVHTEQQFSVPIINPATGRPMRGKRYGGKIDKIIRVDGVLSIMEHKTTSDSIDPDSDYFKRLRIDSQIGNYFLACRQMGIPVQQIIYDVIRKPGLRPSQVPVLDEDGLKIVVDENGERVRNSKGGGWKQAPDSKAGYSLLTRPESPEEYGQRVRGAILAEPEKHFTRRVIGLTEADVLEARQTLYDKAQRLMYHERVNSWPRNDKACIGFGRCPAFDLCTNGFNPDDGVVPDGWVKVDNPHQELEITE